MDHLNSKKITISFGDLYIRRMVIGDVVVFEGLIDENFDKKSTNLNRLGERTLRMLVSNTAESGSGRELSDEVYERLSSGDVEKLARGVASVYDVELLPSADFLESLGSVIFDRVVPTLKRSKEQLEKISLRLGKNFNSLSPVLQGAIGKNIQRIGSISEGLRQSSAIQSLHQSQKVYPNPLGDGLAAGLENITRVGALASQNGRFASLVGDSKNIEFSSLPGFDFSKTPEARAASASEAAAEQLREVAGLAAQMAEQIGTLHTTFLTEVLPEWKSSLQENTVNANRSLRHAVMALVISIVVSVLLAVAQFWVGYVYNSESSAQQTVSERVSSQQLSALKEIKEQLSESHTDMRNQFREYNKKNGSESISRYFLFPGV